MDKEEARAVRIRELFEDEANDVLACGVIKMGRVEEESCQFCNSFYICKKVFEEEAEGGGGNSPVE